MPLRAFCDDVARALSFLGRLPVPDRFFVNYDGRLSRAVRAFPLAGLLLALPAALVLAALLAIGGDPLMSGFLALCLQILLTGALHEDGLCDTADGFGGGQNRDQALGIMKDSRIGVYGAAAMILSIGLRAAALAALARAAGPAGAALAVLATAAISRAALVWHWQALPPARIGGVAAGAGLPEKAAARIAFASGGLIAVLCGFPLAPPAALLAALLAPLALTYLFTALARRRIDGHTGDTLGATQQIAEISTLCALALAA